jgi:type IV secretion system protein VirB10
MSLEIGSSPTQLSTDNKRLSKIPLGIIAVMVILILFAIVYAAIVRKQSQSRQDSTVVEENRKQSQSNAKDINSYIDTLSQVPQQKTLPVSTPKEEIPVQAPISTMHEKRPTPPTIPMASDNTPQIDQKELQRKQDMRLKALTSTSKIGGQKEDRNLQNQTAQKTVDTNANNALMASLAASAEKLSEREATELLKRTANKGYLQQQKQKQISPYEIKAGWVIPATLITGINSDLPGSTLAQVSQNVYDTATGRYLLIPQGTKIIGEYKSNVLYGQERVLSAWTKLIFPNGDTLSLEGMNGTSQDGYSGFTDQVNNHYLRIFGSAFLMSSITAGIALSDNSSGQKETSADKAMSQAIEQMSTVASEMIRKNMNISPTLEIRPGYKFNIFVTKDIILEPLRIEKGE